MSSATPGGEAPARAGRLHDLAAAPRLAIITDLDGTLTPIRPTPEEVTVDADLIATMVGLAGRDGVEVVVASGRPRDFLDRWFAHAPAITLSAEHGAWLRVDGLWERAVDAAPDELAALVDALEQLAREEPGLRVEPKSLCCAIHTRGMPTGPKERAVARTESLVERFVGGHEGWVRLRGHEVIEVRPRGASKRLVVDRARARGVTPMLVLGDDVTDEDMFAALGADDLAVLVSQDPDRPTAAHARVETPAEVKAIFAWVLAARTGEDSAPPPRLERTSGSR